MTLQIHQRCTCSNSPIMPTTPSMAPTTLPYEPKQSPCLQHHIITQDDEDYPMAINFIQHQFWRNHPHHLHLTLPPQTIDNMPLVKHYANPVIHPETGETITSYEKLANHPLTKETWTKAMGMELGNIAQGHKATITWDTHTVFFLDHNSIKCIPEVREIAYAHIVVDYTPKIWSKQSKNHTWREPHQILSWSHQTISSSFHYQNTFKHCHQ